MGKIHKQYQICWTNTVLDLNKYIFNWDKYILKFGQIVVMVGVSRRSFIPKFEIESHPWWSCSTLILDWPVCPNNSDHYYHECCAVSTKWWQHDETFLCHLHPMLVPLNHPKSDQLDDGTSVTEQIVQNHIWSLTSLTGAKQLDIGAICTNCTDWWSKIRRAASSRLHQRWPVGRGWCTTQPHR